MSNSARLIILSLAVGLSACDSSVAPLAGTITANSGTSITAIAGAALLPRPSVIVKSQQGVALKGVPVRFRVTGGGGTITGDLVNTDASGIATVGSWTLGTALGVNSLTAESGSLTGSPITFTARTMPLLGGAAPSAEYYHITQYGPLWCVNRGELIVCDYRHASDPPGYGASQNLLDWRSSGATMTTSFFAPFGMDGVSTTEPSIYDPAIHSRYVGYTQEAAHATYALALAPGTYACYTGNNVFWDHPGDNVLHQTDCNSVADLRWNEVSNSADAQVDLWLATQEIRCEFLPTRAGHPLYCARGGHRAAGVAITKVDFSFADGCGGQGTSTVGQVVVGFSDPNDCNPYVYELTPSSLGNYDALTFTCEDNYYQPADCDAVFVMTNKR